MLSGPFEVQDSVTLGEIIHSLRVASWRSVGVLPEAGFAAGVCGDEHEAHSLHWAVKDDDRVVAAARLCVHGELSELPDSGFYEGLGFPVPAPIAVLSRLVVHPDYQRRGISKKLDSVRVAAAKALGCSSVIGTASPPRVRPLEDQGFRAVSPANLTAAPDWLKAAMGRGQFERTVMVLLINA